MLYGKARKARSHDQTNSRARGWARVGSSDRALRPGACPGTEARRRSEFRTPWGDPDIQGIFTTDDELGVPFERPEQFAGREGRDRRGVRARQTQAERQAEADAEEFVAPPRRADAAAAAPDRRRTGSSAASRRAARRSSIDPADGRIPYLNDEARQRAANAVNARTTGKRPFDGPEAMDLYDRCITRGFPHVIFPTIYNNTSQIVQGPGYVAIRYEMIHDARVIPLDGRPQLSSTIRQYFGDSRGHWEGDTLVVDVTNFPTNIVNYRGADGCAARDRALQPRGCRRRCVTR